MIENTVQVPAQVFDNGVTVIKAVMGTVLTLVAVNALIVPDPLVASPIAAFVLVHA